MALRWNKIQIVNDNKDPVEAIAPVVMSASRATDIPAFHSRWFMDRLDKGHLKWVNPFNRKAVQYVSFKNVRAIVFWTKNPAPLMKQLKRLDDSGIHYYFQFTVNDYEREGYEPNVPPLARRLDLFEELSQKLGPGRVVWRYDPLLLSRTLTPERLLERIARIGERLVPCTDSLVFSFADVQAYRKVRNNLIRRSGEFDADTIDQAELNHKQQLKVAAGLGNMLQQWRQTVPEFSIGTCAEDIDLESYGIVHNRCIDDDRLARLFPHDAALMKFMGRDPAVQGDLFEAAGPAPVKLKDPGQRKVCGCIFSKDIGSYDTCNHLCVYCYANTSPTAVRNNLTRLDKNSESLLPV